MIYSKKVRNASEICTVHTYKYMVIYYVPMIYGETWIIPRELVYRTLSKSMQNFKILGNGNKPVVNELIHVKIRVAIKLCKFCHFESRINLK